MSLYSSVSGINKIVTKHYGSASGSNKEIKEIYGVAGGVNKKVYSSVLFELANVPVDNAQHSITKLTDVKSIQVDVNATLSVKNSSATFSLFNNNTNDSFHIFSDRMLVEENIYASDTLVQFSDNYGHNVYYILGGATWAGTVRMDLSPTYIAVYVNNTFVYGNPINRPAGFSFDMYYAGATRATATYKNLIVK